MNLSKVNMKKQQQNYEELVQKQVDKVTKKFLKKPESKKNKMMNSFNTINIRIFAELERIKKPQKYALQAGKMLCLLVNAFRDKPVKESFDSWNIIQFFVT